MWAKLLEPLSHNQMWTEGPPEPGTGYCDLWKDPKGRDDRHSVFQVLIVQIEI